MKQKTHGIADGSFECQSKLLATGRRHASPLISNRVSIHPFSLTPALSRREREGQYNASRTENNHSQFDSRTLLPLPAGEGLKVREKTLTCRAFPFVQSMFVKVAFFLLLISVLPTEAAGPPRDDFKVVVTRNIFNPNRGYKPPPPKKEKPRQPAPPRKDEFTLTGVMTAPTNSYAFFDGTDRSYRRVARVNEEIEEFKVLKISTDGVELKWGTNTVKLAPRERLTKTGDEPWKKGEGRSNLKNSGSLSSTSSSSSSSDSSGKESEASSEDAERKKRLLEILKARRKK